MSAQLGATEIVARRKARAHKGSRSSLLCAVTRWLTTAQPPARPVMPLHDEDIDQLERAVKTARKGKSHLPIDQERLVALVEKAIKALRSSRDEDTTVRFILTLVWQSRKRVSGDYWAVIDREKDAMANMMLEKYFGGTYENGNGKKKPKH